MTAVPNRRRLLLVGWDAVDWGMTEPLLRSGALPHLTRLIAQGSAGDLSTLYPVSTPLLWTSALTGTTADRHGIFGYAKSAEKPDDEPRRPALVTPADRRAPALWDFVARVGGTSHVVNWPCSYPAYGVGGLYVSDAVTRGLAVDTFDELHAPQGWITAPPPFSEEDGDALRMAAGEVDAPVLARFLDRGSPIPGWLTPALAACFTVHNFATTALESQDTDDNWNLAAIRYPGLLPLAVARARGGSDAAHDTAALEGLLHLHDLFLGRLLELVGRGPETAVLLVSAHGFPARMVGNETDLRSGMMVACQNLSGEHPNKLSKLSGNQRLLGAGLLDVAPTALALLGFEPTVATETGMTGRILVPLAPTLSPPLSIPTEPGVPAESESWTVSMTWKSATLTPEKAAAALGDLPPEGLIPLNQATGDESAVQSVFFSQLWAQARVVSFARRPAESVPLLQELLAAVPENVDVAFLLANDLQAIGRRKEAGEIITPLLASDAAFTPEVNARAHFFSAEDTLSHGKRAEAMSHLSQAAALTTSPGLLLGIGRALYRLRRFRDADACFIRVLDTDPMEPIAWMGHAGMAILTRRNEEAIEYARRAISLRHDSALSHLILARALRATNHPREARAAYAMAMRLGIHAHKTAGSLAPDYEAISSN